MEKGNDSQRVRFTWKMFLLSFAFLIGMIPLFWYQFYRIYQYKAIARDRAFTGATVIRFGDHTTRAGHRWCSIEATYRVGNASHICAGKTSAVLSPEQRQLLVGTRLPVIYEKTDPSNSYLLSSKAVFDRFNLAFPDSLAWTKLYFTD